MKYNSRGLIFSQGKLLLIKHSPIGKWVIPGGHTEKQENLKQALTREIEEELNIEIKFLQKYKSLDKKEGIESLPPPFYNHTLEDKRNKRQVFYYLCYTHSPSKMNIKNSEIYSAKWFTYKEVLNSPEMPEGLRKLYKRAFYNYFLWKFRFNFMFSNVEFIR